VGPLNSVRHHGRGFRGYHCLSLLTRPAPRAERQFPSGGQDQARLGMFANDIRLPHHPSWGFYAGAVSAPLPEYSAPQQPVTKSSARGPQTPRRASGGLRSQLRCLALASSLTHYGSRLSLSALCCTIATQARGMAEAGAVLHRLPPYLNHHR
jgi:hypothetical protein